MTIEELRAQHAKALSDWYAGITDRHPHGRSGLEGIIPYDLSSDTWDTHPRGWEFSEWGNQAGSV